MPGFRNWESTLIGEEKYFNVQIREVKEGKYELMFATQSQDSSIDQYSQKANKAGGSYTFPYDPNDKRIPKFAISMMEKTSDDLTDLFRMYRKKGESYKNLAPTLKRAIGIEQLDSGNIIEFERVDANKSIVTGDGREIIIFMDIINRRG